MSTISENFEFSKDWTDAGDFPTKEYSEQVVRANIQLLFDEIKTFLNDVVLTAINDNMARITNLGAGDNVEHDSLSDDSVWANNIKDGEITEEKYKDGSILPEKFNATEVDPYIKNLADERIDELAVLGVKGSAESDYRKGQVNLSKDNLGLSNVENKSSSQIREELTANNIDDALGYTPLGPSDIIETIDAPGVIPDAKYVGDSIRSVYNMLNESKADINSPTFTGSPTSPSPTLADRSTRLATTEWVRQVMFSNQSHLSNDASYVTLSGTTTELGVNKGANKQNKSWINFAAKDPSTGNGHSEITFHGDLVPDDGSTWSLGGSSYTLDSVYADDFYGTVHSSSDKRLKKDIDYDMSAYLKLFDTLKPCHFRYKNDEAVVHTGFIAQEVAESLNAEGIEDSSFVQENGDNGMLTMNYIDLIGMLTAKIQDLQKQVDELKGKGD